MVVAFLGLGNLGRAIAKRLKEVFGDDLIMYVWTQDMSKSELVSAEIGAIPLRYPQDIPENTEIIFLCLFNSEAVENILKKIKINDGRIIVDLTTNYPSKAQEFEKKVKEEGGKYLECPVIGSVIPASQGKLTLVVSGEKSAYERVEWLLKAIAQKIFYLGDNNVGYASKIKLINNLVLGSFMCAIAEAIAVGEKLGIPKELIIDVLENGAGRSSLLEAKKEKIKNENFIPHFSVALIKKDLTYLRNFLHSAEGNRKINEDKDDLQMLKSAEDLFDQAIKRGFGQLDFSSVYLVIKEKIQMKK